MIPAIPTTPMISTEDIPGDQAYQGLRILRAQSDPKVTQRFNERSYRFQYDTDYTIIRGTLTRKGMVTGQYRISVYTHPTLTQFKNMVQYDPSNPPVDNYDALGMMEAHAETQSDFKGQKQTNKILFKEYLQESVAGTRTAYLPAVSGWQTKVAFAKTIFVAYDEDDPDALYGLLYLPKLPIMQADGQTQTAALFALAASKDAIDGNALESFRVTLEIELNVNENKAGQSFADRNGRGSKKNKNLVIGLDRSSSLSQLREASIEGTIFERRVAKGRTTLTSETATENIVDLSTMEQMLMRIITESSDSSEIFKHYHVAHFTPYTRDFILMLERLFGKQWPEKTPANQDTFRRLYVHGWPFALKAIASAYYRSRIAEIGPLTRSLRAKDTGKTLEKAFLDHVEEEKLNSTATPEITFAELEERLSKIDWLRYRQHWVNLTGWKLGKDGKMRTFKLKSTGEDKVLAQAQNTASVIAAVRDKILSPTWTDLTSDEDQQVG